MIIALASQFYVYLPWVAAFSVIVKTDCETDGSFYSSSAGGRGRAAGRGGGGKNRIIHHDNFNLFYSTQEYIKSSARNKCKWKSGFQYYDILILWKYLTNQSTT